MATGSKFTASSLKEDFKVGLYMIDLRASEWPESTDEPQTNFSREEILGLIPKLCMPRLRSVYQYADQQYLLDFIWNMAEDQIHISSLFCLTGRSITHDGVKYEVKVDLAHAFNPDCLDEMVTAMLNVDPNLNWFNPAFMDHPHSTPIKPTPVDPATKQLIEIINGMDSAKVAEIRAILDAKLGSKPKPLVPEDDLEKTLYTNNQALIKSLVTEGLVHRDLPKLDHFFGATEGPNSSKLTFEQYRRQVVHCAGKYDPGSVKEAMYKSCKGKAQEIISTCPENATWKEMLEKLRVQFSVVAAHDVLMKKFYGMTQSTEQVVGEWAATLEVFFSSVYKAYPDKFGPGQYAQQLRDRFYHGLHHNIKVALRPQHKDKGLSFEELVEEARKIEEDLDTSAPQAEGLVGSTTKTSTGGGVKSKVKVQGSSVVMDQGYFNNLEKLMKANQEGLAQTQAQIQSLTALFSNWPTASNSARVAAVQVPNISNRQNTEQAPLNGNQQQGPTQTYYQNNQGNYQGRGRGRGGPRGRGNRGQRTPLCHFCKQNRPNDANHWQSDCQHYQVARSGYWQNRGPGTQETNPQGTHTHASANRMQNQGNQQGGH